MNLVRRVQDLEGRALARVGVPADRVPVAVPADVLAVLAEQVNAVRADPSADPVERARTLGFLAGIALRAMEQGETRARLESLERVLKLRQADAKDDARRR